jgi:3',5'-cyclic AMP phosphodiesterase CpdA
MIGFDVTVDGKPYGEASPGSLAWLKNELEASAKARLVIVVTHQLLLPTTPLDTTPEWSLWMVKNHFVVRELLEQFPNVRMVISGHHHASRVETVNNITYVADPAIVTYPCAFRLFAVGPEGIHLKNIGLDEKNIIARARDLLVSDPYARLYDAADPSRVLAYSLGLTDQDRETTIPLL